MELRGSGPGRAHLELIPARGPRAPSLRPLCLALLALQLAAKLGVLLEYVRNDPFFAYQLGDSRIYLDWSTRILAGLPYGPNAYYHAPGYPALLAGMRYLTGDTG